MQVFWGEKRGIHYLLWRLTHAMQVSLRMREQIWIVQMSQHWLQSNRTCSMQHAMSPPFGHSNTQDRARCCCSSAELLAPTWPRRSLNTPTALTTQTLKSCFPRHTSLRTKEDEVEEPRLSSSRT